jgi:hypothetical protein
MCQLLNTEELELEELGETTAQAITKRVSFLKDPKPTLLHFLWVHRNALAEGYYPALTAHIRYFQTLITFGLVLQSPDDSKLYLSEDGRQFLLRLRLEWR